MAVSGKIAIVTCHERAKKLVSSVRVTRRSAEMRGGSADADWMAPKSIRRSATLETSPMTDPGSMNPRKAASAGWSSAPGT